jgi:hypothetical protein
LFLSVCAKLKAISKDLSSLNTQLLEGGAFIRLSLRRIKIPIGTSWEKEDFEIAPKQSFSTPVP